MKKKIARSEGDGGGFSGGDIQIIPTGRYSESGSNIIGRCAIVLFINSKK